MAEAWFRSDTFRRRVLPLWDGLMRMPGGQRHRIQAHDARERWGKVLTYHPGSDNLYAAMYHDWMVPVCLHAKGSAAGLCHFRVDLDASDLRDRSCECGKRDACAVCFARLLQWARRIDDAVAGHLPARYVRLWVASGRRGMHLWVLHPTLTGLSRAQRGRLLRKVTPEGAPVDAAVTIEQSHNMRLPFSPHPGSQRMAVPVRIFEPVTLETAPKLTELGDLAGRIQILDEAVARYLSLY